jgi:hypothetical protein
VKLWEESGSQGGDEVVQRDTGRARGKATEGRGGDGREREIVL